MRSDDTTVRTPKPRLLMLPVGRLLPSPDNPRRSPGKAGIRSLARSLASDGVLQPVVVRPHPEKEGFYEIRAGERRWRAAKEAGLAEVPALVRVLDDGAALSVTIAENHQREALHPLEEAAAFQLAIDRGTDVRALASRLGRSPRFVARRASLTRLTEAWKQAAADPASPVAALAPAHLELVARLPVATQDALAEDGFAAVFRAGVPSVEGLRRMLDGALRTLSAAPWALDDETLAPEAGSCLACSKRSGRHPLLFEGEPGSEERVGPAERCLDAACFDRKRAAHLLAREAEARRRHPALRLVAVTYDGLPAPLHEAVGERLSRLHGLRPVRASAPGAVPVMPVDGPRAGSVVHVAAEEAEAHSPRRTSRPAGPDGRPRPLSMEEKRERLTRRRDAFLVARVGELLRGLDEEGARRVWESRGTRSAEDASLLEPAALLLAFGTGSRRDRPDGGEAWVALRELAAAPAPALAARALLDAAQVWRRRLGGDDPRTVADRARDARLVCRLLGLDLAGLEREAEAAVPTPRSWPAPTQGPTLEHAAEECPFDADPPREDQRRAAPPPSPAPPTKRRRRGR